MTKWDKIIISILLIISFTPTIIFAITTKKNYDSTYAVVSIDGKFYKEVKLTNHKGEENLVIESNKGKNILIIKDEKIAIIDADCPDKVCMEPGFIYKPGQTLVCLPHRLIVEIKGKVEDEDIIDVKTY